MTPADQKRRDADLRTRVKRIFSKEPTVRADAIEALKECWAYDEPSFRADELNACDPQAATLMAAKRDGQKEIITWLSRIQQHEIPPQED